MSVSSPKETKSPEADMVSVSGGFFDEGKRQLSRIPAKP